MRHLQYKAVWQTGGAFGCGAGNRARPERMAKSATKVPPKWRQSAAKAPERQSSLRPMRLPTAPEALATWVLRRACSHVADCPAFDSHAFDRPLTHLYIYDLLTHTFDTPLTRL